MIPHAKGPKGPANFRKFDGLRGQAMGGLMQRGRWGVALHSHAKASSDEEVLYVTSDEHEGAMPHTMTWGKLDDDDDFTPTSDAEVEQVEAPDDQAQR